jgi:hypothetical protein
MKKGMLFFLLFFICTIFFNNDGYSFSINRKINSADLHNDAAGFLKLSYREFAILTDQKQSLKNKVFFFLIRSKLKQDLKKHPGQQWNNLLTSGNSSFQKVLFWTLIGVFVLIGLFLLIFGLAPR